MKIEEYEMYDELAKSVLAMVCDDLKQDGISFPQEDIEVEVCEYKHAVAFMRSVNRLQETDTALYDYYFLSRPEKIVILFMTKDKYKEHAKFFVLSS